MTTAELAVILRELADLTDIRGGSVEAGDMRRAADAVLALRGTEATRFLQRARKDHLEAEPGISPAIRWRIRDVVLGDPREILQAARYGLPSLLRHLLELPAISTAEAAQLSRLGVLTLADLHTALDDHRLAHLSGGEPLVDSLRRAALALDLNVRAFTLGRAFDILEPVLLESKRCCPSLDLLEPSGDVRRFEPLVGSLILIGRAIDPPSAIDALCGMNGLDDVLHRSGRRALLLVHQVEVDVRIAAPDEHGTMLFQTTGSGAHVHAVAERRSRPTICAREEDVYRQAGLAFIPAEMRNATGELEAAAAGGLPALVTRADIRGDLHMHTTYSDGRDTVEAMIAECMALGYEYIAITDHSERAAASRTVSADQLARQRDEIARLRETHPMLTILHGIEVDILPDGSLDFADALLEPLDIVLASLHESARQDGRTLTRRCIQAIRHPLVNVISHPANRLVGRRSGYPLDFPAVYAAAAETGTALEIDGAPGHLDLDGEHARAAAAAGVTVTIDSDCHRARSLDRQMRMGIGTARRGWIAAEHVLNARSIDEVRAFLAAKRVLR